MRYNKRLKCSVIAGGVAAEGAAVGGAMRCTRARLSPSSINNEGVKLSKSVRSVAPPSDLHY